MFSVFVKIGIPRSQLAFKNRNFEKCSLDELVIALAWLELIKIGNYLLLRDILAESELNKFTLMQDGSVTREFRAAKVEWRGRPEILTLEYKCR